MTAERAWAAGRFRNISGVGTGMECRETRHPKCVLNTHFHFSRVESPVQQAARLNEFVSCLILFHFTSLIVILNILFR